METINLQDGLLGGKVNIALVQLESPFHNELNHVEYGGDKVFFWHDIGNRKKKIISILNNIKNITDSETRPDIIVFPEYSVPCEILQEVKEFSKYYKIIIAGTDQIRTQQDEMYRKNACPVIIQDREVLFIEKNSLSVDEIGIVEPGTMEKSSLELNWTTSSGEDLCIQISICLDFLYNNCELDKNKKGCIVVPLCSKSMKEFVGHQYTDVRFHKFVLFCNAVSMNDKEPIMAGCSAVYGSDNELDKRDAIISLNDDLEGVIFVKLDLEHPAFSKPTTLPSTKPVVFKKAYKIDDSGELITIETGKKGTKVGIINPELFLENLKLLNFFFAKTVEYAKTIYGIKDLGEDATFDSFGVLGNYDTICTNFLSGDDRFNLKKFLEQYTRFDPIRIEVRHIYKFYGYELNMLPSEILESLPGKSFLYKKIQSLSEDWNAPDTTEDERRRFEESGLILGDYELVDMRAENLIRAFVAVELRDGEAAIANLFERAIIKNYLSSIYGVNSLYKTTNREGGGFRCDYLIDIIDEPHSIFDILTELHRKSEDINAQIFSNTFVVADQLSRGLFNSLPLDDLEDGIYDLPVKDIIGKDEGQKVEFKSSLRWHYADSCVSKELEFQIAKIISAFMNSYGGVLLIGVDDQGAVLGLEKDFSTFGKKKDVDGFELQLGSVIGKYMDKKYRQQVHVSFDKIDEKIVCKVEVRPSTEPVYLKGGKGTKEFYIRTGNSSQPVEIDEISKYIATHWR